MKTMTLMVMLVVFAGCVARHAKVETMTCNAGDVVSVDFELTDGDVMEAVYVYKDENGLRSTTNVEILLEDGAASVTCPALGDGMGGVVHFLRHRPD